MSMGYRYFDSNSALSHQYILPAVTRILEGIPLRSDEERRIFELGCGNGSFANELANQQWIVTGIDASREGIEHARKAYPGLNLNLGSAYDDLVDLYGQFPIVLSLEVVEHLYDPRTFAKNCFKLVANQGHLIVSTPFHGYWKNLALALMGKMDKHFTALWDHGHIKFWSMLTLTVLLEEAGFSDVQFVRVGRIEPLAKSMIAIAQKP